ncbi:hypothetical protein LX81_03622 [Palleronia aestuarii]|uniref:Uncharacterized protein n=1 Tax=Palleronia aestuarii TaxID=568105 RepID=A0A2W7N680_9RHOB|nr:hypothetical protein LX81_03622 [Palleronia aestuarii]
MIVPVIVDAFDGGVLDPGLPLSGGLVSVLVHDGSRRHCRGRRRGRSCALRWPFDGLRSRWSVAKRRVGPRSIVMDPPRFDHHARLGEGVKNLAVQKLVAELRVEALAIPVLPRAPRFDERRLRADRCNPVPHGLGDEFRPIARPEEALPRGISHARSPQIAQQVAMTGSQVSTVVFLNHTAEGAQHAITATHSIAPTLLVAIDISKHRHEVLIGVPSKKRRRRMTIMNTLEDSNACLRRSSATTCRFGSASRVKAPP